MLKYKQNLKTKQLKSLTNSTVQSNYFLICRYFDLTVNELVFLKSELKSYHITIHIFKKTLLPYKLKVQGPILIMMCQQLKEIEFLLNFLQSHTKIDPLFLIYLNSTFSIFKLFQLFKGGKRPVPNLIKFPLMRFYQTLLILQNSWRV